jgi:hypothetical protein
MDASHLQVCTAVAQQMFQLNTNSRYLHDTFSSFAEALTDTMPDPLSVMCAHMPTQDCGGDMQRSILQRKVTVSL